MFPGQVVHGHVDSIAPASGQEFALLPPDNATGNFTKVVQRIPVQDRARCRQNPLRRTAARHVGYPDHRDAIVEREPRDGGGRQRPQGGFRSIVPCQIRALSRLDIRAADLARSI